MELHRGRLLDHLHLKVRDLTASRRFYEAALGALGIPVVAADTHFFADELWVDVDESGDARSHVHFAFQAKDTAQVDAFHKAALAAGGKDKGAPGERTKYHPGYYAAFVLDPDGNNIEAVYHGPYKRSAASVTINF